MTSNAILVVVAVAVFFAGIGVSYAVFSSTYDPTTMKFRNQDLFDQMMSNNPKMTGSWMENQMMNEFEQRDTIMHQMMQDFDTREHMMGHLMADEELKEMMGITLPTEPGSSSMMDSSMMENSMSDMQFNIDAPITMPMIDGYYNGEKVFFVHTEVSDKDMADMMSQMINFPTLHVSNLKNISPDEMSKVYVFTNGIRGSEPYGGGPFMYQIDVFDSIPDHTGYSQFRVPHLVTWNDNSIPRIMTSVDEILEAQSNGELTIQKTDNVVNAPMVVWKSGGMEQRASMIQRMFESMPGVDGEVTNVDVDNYLVMLKMHSKNGMGMMDMMN